MIRTDDVAGEATRYLARVEQQLDDLDPRLRPVLVHDLHEHLTEVAAEPGGSLEARLGPPEVYAAELRAAAGLPPRWSAPVTRPPAAPQVTRRSAPAARPARRVVAAAVALLAAVLVLAALAGLGLLQTRSPAAEEAVPVPVTHVVVPDVVGLDAAAADEALESVGLDLAGSDRGRVAVQEPPSGTAVPRGTEVIVGTWVGTG